MTDTESDIQYFVRRLILAIKSGNKKRAAALKKKLLLMGDALLIYRLIRAPDRNII